MLFMLPLDRLRKQLELQLRVEIILYYIHLLLCFCVWAVGEASPTKNKMFIMFLYSSCGCVFLLMFLLLCLSVKVALIFSAFLSEKKSMYDVWWRRSQKEHILLSNLHKEVKSRGLSGGGEREVHITCLTGRDSTVWSECKWGEDHEASRVKALSESRKGSIENWPT